MSQQDTQSLWEYLESKYSYGEFDSPSFSTKLKGWITAGLVLVVLEVVIYLAGKSIRIKRS